MSRCQIYQPSTRGFHFARNSGAPRPSSPHRREYHPPLNSWLPASHLAIMLARFWSCQEGGVQILPFVVEGGFVGFRASETSGMRRTIAGSPENSFLRVIPRYGTVSRHGSPCPPRASMVPVRRRARQRGHQASGQPASYAPGAYRTNEPAHHGTGDNLKPWKIANQRAEGISPASGHVILASRHRAEPATPDELVPWFQGIMVTNEPMTPMALETMTHGLHQQLGSEEQMALKPAGASWKVETMERRAIVSMTRVRLITTWYQGRSRPRSQDAQEPG